MKAPLISFISIDDFQAALGASTPLTHDDLNLLSALWAKHLPPLISVEAFGVLLGVSPKLLGAMATRPNRYYRQFEIPKRSGGMRTIVAPKRFIKAVQRFILAAILESSELPRNVTGFAKGRGVADNCLPHVGARYLLNVDIQDFFGSVRSPAVGQIFRNYGFPGPVVSVLTGICTLAGALPQGAPTSPALANLVFLHYDFQLLELTREHGVEYTRYADDMTFSSYRPLTAEFLDKVRRIVANGQFTLNTNKIRFARPGQAKYVTGMVVNEKLHPRRHMRRELRAMFHAAKVFPEKCLETRSTLLGYAGYTKSYHPELGATYLQIAKAFKDSRPTDE